MQRHFQSLTCGSYLFGGFGSPNGTGLGDVYVLTLPSFQWILVSEHFINIIYTYLFRKIWPTPQQTVFPGGKGWSSCSVFRDSQMIIIGGYLTNTSKTDCDVPNIGGQHGLLLGQEHIEQGTDGKPAWWHAPMDNVTGYRVPDQIVARIGGEYVLEVSHLAAISLTLTVLTVMLLLRHPS